MENNDETPEIVYEIALVLHTLHCKEHATKDYG